MEPYLYNLFQLAISATLNQFPKIIQPDDLVNISRGKTTDYQFNSLPKIMILLKKENIQLSLSEFTEALKIHITKYDTHALIQKIELCKVFLNITIKSTSIIRQFFCCPKIEKVIAPLKYIVDYSSPNIAKSLHIGHLRSTVIGESITTFLKFRGHHVKGINHIGDWGTQFGILLHFLKTRYPDLDKLLDYLSSVSCEELTQIYREAKKLFDTSKEFANRSRKETCELQQGNEQNQIIWKQICKISESEYQTIYQLLNINNLEQVGESFYQSLIPKVLGELESKRLIQTDNGAKIIRLQGHKYPLIVTKSDGGYTYDTTDLAAIYYRTQIEHADRIIYVTDISQRNHFIMCFEVARLMGWVVGSNKLMHIGFGLVLGKDGKKLKTRSGETIKLTDVIQEIIGRSEQIMREKIQIHLEANENTKYYENLNEMDIHRISQKVGINTLKYYDLKHTYDSNYKYNPEVMFQFNGNTGVYLMYVYARINGILEKSKYKKKDFASILEKLQKWDLNPTKEERELMLHICSLPIILDKLEQNLEIYVLIDYLYKLTSLFNTFNCQKNGKIIGTVSEKYRIGICMIVSRTIRLLFSILTLQEVSHI